MGFGFAQDAMAQFPGLQYCKTDLMVDKGVVFCKYGLSSQALLALETINTLGTVRAHSLYALKPCCKIHLHV